MSLWGVKKDHFWGVKMTTFLGPEIGQKHYILAFKPVDFEVKKWSFLVSKRGHFYPPLVGGPLLLCPPPPHPVPHAKVFSWRVRGHFDCKVRVLALKVVLPTLETLVLFDKKWPISPPDLCKK